MMRARDMKRRFASRWGVLGICFLAPTLMGGCPELRNEVVNVTNTAVQGLVLGDLGQEEAFTNVARGTLSAAIDAFFDQLRAPGN